MTRMTGPDCVVMCNLVNTYIHTYIFNKYTYIHTYIHVWGGRLQGELVMVLPVCRISVSICCDKRRETSFTVPAESGRSGERSCSCVHAYF